MKRIFPGIALLLSLMFIQNAGAQNMQEAIAKLSGEAAKKYVAPVVSGFASNLNTGWYHKAPAPTKYGFHVEGGLVTMATLLGSGKKNFSSNGQFTFSEEQSEQLVGFVDGYNITDSAKREIKDSLKVRLATIPQNVGIRGPTITGNRKDTVRIYFAETKIHTGIDDPTYDTITVPPDSIALDGVTGLLGSLPALPLFAPQLTVGTLYGTNLTLRWLPQTETTEEVGAVKFFGFGIQHNPSVWMATQPPVDVSFGYFQQNLQVGDIFKANSWAAGLNVSKTYGWRFLNVTPYGGVQYESATMKFSYQRVVVIDEQEQNVDVKFDLKGENHYRATAGLSMRLLAINLNADYSYSAYPAASLGIMVGI